ncbi:MAG: argininosuccinate lyase, partial [Gammaproteobacteria bacterium]
MNSNNNIVKSWGGRFSAPTAGFVEQFTQSVSYDQRLYHYDIMGSIAHVRMLAKVGV